ncbi:MAG: carbohydrate binding domain-containing protein [Anaerolineae bacterium]|nr:carbohydrate binding domain-containing protein [Anaerolineae bacterium]
MDLYPYTHSFPGFHRWAIRLLLGLSLLIISICPTSAFEPEGEGLRPGTDTSATLSTSTTGWFPLALPWDDDSATWVDASDLLLDEPGDDPAALIDDRGFVETDGGGHFVFADTGRRARFWGINLCFGANFPPCPDYPPDPGEFDDVDAAEKLAGRLAKLGFNAVRLHHTDNGSRPWGLWLEPWEDTQQLDPVQLGRLDCLIYQLKQHGIYVDLNFHVSREFTRGDGVTGADDFQGTRVHYNKGATLFDPVMIALQQQYAQKLLSHVNPHTGLAYAGDPVILTTETTNEDSFFLSFAGDGLNYDPADPESFPEFYSSELDGWTNLSVTGPTINRLLNPGFEAGLTDWFTHTKGSAQAGFSLAPDAFEGDQALQVEVIQTGAEDWHVQFGQTDPALLEGKTYRLTFAARASQPITVCGTVMRNSEPWDTLGWADEVALTTGWLTHTVVFTATETIFGGARVSFDVGQAPLTLWFDGFRFHEEEAFRGWLGWLEDRYDSTAALGAAWAPAGTVSETEMLTNGSFESGLTGWQTQTFTSTAATWSLDPTQATSGTQSLQVTVTQVDGTDWHVQFWQPGLVITAGQKYRVSFDAQAGAPGKIGFNVMQAHEPWDGLGLWGAATLSTTWGHYEATFEATQDETNGRLGFTVGQAVRTLWFDDVSLKPYNPRGLLSGESLETNHVARLRRDEMDSFTPQRVRDTLQFYDETQAAYFAVMRDVIQDDFGSRSLNTGTASYINSLPDVRAMAALDFVDNHTYWDHPDWPDVLDWSPTGWFIDNEAWVNYPLEGLFDLAVTAIEDKPFTVTEFNEVFPNRYAVEGPLLMATFANLQDWDAVFMFAYTHDQLDYDAEQVTGFFDMAGNPVATGLMPVAARLFLGQQTDPAPTESLLEFTQPETYDSVGYGWAGSGADFLQEAKGVSPAAAFGSQLRTASFTATTPVTPALPTPAGPVYTSAGGQLTWDVSEPERGLFTFDAPQAQGAVGFLAGRAVTLTNLALAFPTGTAQFGAITLQSRNGQPITVSEKLLLDVFTRVENTGMVWNENETSLDDRWGTAPALIEPIRFTVTLALSDTGDVEVWALDETGALHHCLAHQAPAPGQVRFLVDTGADTTLWYAVRRALTVYLPVVMRSGDS